MCLSFYRVVISTIALFAVNTLLLPPPINTVWVYLERFSGDDLAEKTGKH